jgi:hypothetical protein
MALTGEENIYNLALGYVGEYKIEDTAASRLLKQYTLCSRFYELARDEVLVSHLWNEAMVRVIIAQEDDDPIFGYDRVYSKPSDALRIVSVDDDLGADLRNNAQGVDYWEVEGDYILSNAGVVPTTWVTNTKYVAGEAFAADARTWVTSTAYIVGEYVKSGAYVYEVLAAHTSSTVAADITAGKLSAAVAGSTGTYKVLTTHTSDTVLNDLTSGYIEATQPEGRVVYVTYVKKLTDTTKYSPKLKQAIAMKLAIKIITSLTNDTKGKVDLINEFETLTMPKARSVDGMQGKPRPIFNSEWIRARRSGTNVW